MFVDEPTTGLDSKMADDVIQLLQNLAHTPRTILCTIHQPSARILGRFDSVVLLAKGRVAYSGPVDQLVPHLTRHGIDISQTASPIERWMELLQDPENRPRLIDAHDKEFSSVGSGEIIPVASAPRAAPHKYARGMLTQAWILTHRGLLDHFKDPKKYLASLVLKAAVGIIVGTAWSNQARHVTQDALFPTQGVCFMACLNTVLNTLLQTAMIVPTTRPLLIREYRNGYYSLIPLYISLLITNGIAQTINSWVFAVPVYFMVGLRSSPIHFGIFLAVLSLLSIIAMAFGLLVGALANDFIQAQQVVAPSMMPMILFAGYLIPYDQLPSYLRWLYYVSYFQYSFNGLLINQFRDMDFPDCQPPVVNQTCYKSCNQCVECFGFHRPICFATGEDFLESLSVREDRFSLDTSILLGYFLLMVVSGYLVTKRVIRTR
eukprot:c1508_g1_i1.p1 GENE.c1508_g1_i1~~c1508_g1_i1.p1  ORF type:complete len:433 (-),score=90.28 c1508_g1_i1:59-1357(-)